VDIPATSDNIPGTLVLRDTTGACSFGTLKTTSNSEVIYATKTTAPFRINHTDGSGRVNISWNVDGANHNIGTAKYFNTDPSMRLQMTGNPGIVFYTAPAGVAGELIAAWTVGLCNTIAGLVGIGTTTPGAKLNVVHNDTTDAVRITQEGSGNALVVEDSTNPDSTPFIVTADGNVGIGVGSSPTSKLHVGGVMTLGQFQGIQSVDRNSNTFISGGSSYDNGANIYLGGPDVAGGHLIISTGAGATNTERMRVDGSGNVGIGLTDPQNYGKLAVSGSLFLSGETSLYNPFGAVDAANRANTYIAFGLGGSGNDWAYLREIGTGNKLELALDLHDDGSDVNAGQAFSIRHLASSLTPDGGAQTLFKVNHDGNVGIGTTIPTERLDVNGTVKAAGFSADGIQIDGQSGRNYFQDSELAGQLRVGAAWGIAGIYAESGRCVVGGASGVTIEPVGSANVGIGTSSPNSKALLDITSTTQGFLPPRMTTTERNAITSPPAGLMVYNTTTNKLNFYNGTAWEAVTSA
jgi:hypothetical protein